MNTIDLTYEYEDLSYEYSPNEKDIKSLIIQHLKENECDLEILEDASEDESGLVGFAGIVELDSGLVAQVDIQCEASFKYEDYYHGDGGEPSWGDWSRDPCGIDCLQGDFWFEEFKLEKKEVA